MRRTKCQTGYTKLTFLLFEMQSNKELSCVDCISIEQELFGTYLSFKTVVTNDIRRTERQLSKIVFADEGLENFEQHE